MNKWNVTEIDGELIFQCTKCGYIITCNKNDKLDLADFRECVSVHSCYRSSDTENTVNPNQGATNE